MVCMYTVKHNYILGSMFTNTKAQLTLREERRLRVFENRVLR